VTAWTSPLHLAVLGRHAGRDDGVDPCPSVDVDVPDRLTDHAPDHVGGLAHRQPVWARRGVLGARVRAGVIERRRHDRRDVLDVDERLTTVAGRHGDRAVDRLQEGLAEVLHEPRGTHD